ncbi:MAG: DUF1592 domain-containing protein [Acidobacteria bacterium]|nr:DUF1592 domain-containing protein [Acidobacteriota bacterium]
MTVKQISVLALASAAGIVSWFAQPVFSAQQSLEPGFEQSVKPFLKQHCEKCHNADQQTSGVRVDNLDATLPDRSIRFWEAIRHRVSEGTMPPRGLPQPTAAEKQPVLDWIARGLDTARVRPAPKNGLVRRLTVAQYRNTLRELLKLEDDLTEILPPDAVSKDGFVNNQETLQLSPLLVETYFEIAEEALNRAVVDTKAKPAIQNFRLDFGASINPQPFPEPLVLGANSLLLNNKDFIVSEPSPVKPFPFEHKKMRTNYRFIEGYQGNDTVRGWREYSSIYHSVFADMRGSRGYPKGLAYSTVPAGLLLRPAIPNEEQFDADGTYGPKANFKISLRELPDNGRFRVIVTASKYNDGLLLDQDAVPRNKPDSLTIRNPKTPQTVEIAKAGIYQLDVHTAEKIVPSTKPDASKLTEGLAAHWTFDDDGKPAVLEGNAKITDSPFGRAVFMQGLGGAIKVPKSPAVDVGAGDFTITAWIHPSRVGRAGILWRGGHEYTHGWNLEIPDGRGTLRLETSGPDGQPNGTITTTPGVLKADAWQHIAVVIKRKGESQIFINGFPVAAGEIGSANLDNPKLDVQFGHIPNRQQFYQGDIDEVRIYRRAIGEAEIQAIVEPGRRFAIPPTERPQDVTVNLGDRSFSSALKQPAFALVRLPAGPLNTVTENTGIRPIDHIVLTPVDPSGADAKRLAVFEKRAPKLGVQVGLRRDCGSTFAPVGAPQVVAAGKPSRYTFEGAIRNFPSPDVEKDNVNYLAGVREIAVRSEYTDGRDMPRLLIKSVEFEGPYYDTWPPQSHTNIFGATQRQARDIVRNFAARAYRRPITAAEESTLMAVFEKSQAAKRGFNESVKDALLVVLTSPQFLFITETSTSPSAEPLTDLELSSKLSYFLWNGPPDAALQQAAATKTLRAKLSAEIDRMVADKRFTQFTREFTSQWLSLDKFSVLEADRKKFPKLSRDVRPHLRNEPIEFVQHLFRNNLPAKNLIVSDFIMVNEPVANYYDMGDKVENGLQFTPVAHGRKELGGVLTQAAIMAGLSDGRESNPVKRGAWVARKIIAEPPADPPPNVPALKEDAKGLTLRQRIEQHRNQPGCRQCHQAIDPWGVAFEEFDAGGRLKKEAADASSKLPDSTEVSGAIDLKRYLSEDRIDQVAFSVMKHLATYATGRTLTYNEQMFLKSDSRSLKANGYRMKDMIHYIVTSKIFLEK